MVALPRLGRARTDGREFIGLVALCMGISAVSIDLLLPAFPEMRDSFGLPVGSTRVSEVITAYFLGLAVGQLVWGPLSDRFGRKAVLYVGLGLFLLGALGAVFQPTLGGLVACRVAWGFGAAAPRSLAVAMVRDTFEGEAMARTMSLVMATFILVPIFAPLVGSVLVDLGPWRAILWLQIAIGLVVVVWSQRLPETLAPADRRPASPRSLTEAARAVLRNRQSVGFALAVTALFGIMTSFIGTAEVVVDETFGAADRFPYVFAALALSLAVGSLTGARLVGRLGLARLIGWTVGGLVVAALIVLAVALATDGRPPLWLFCATVAAALFAVSILVPACNTAAMAPLGHVAGMGAAVVGAASTAGGALLGSLTDGAFDGTITPFAAHTAAYAVAAATAVALLGRAGPVPSPAPSPEPVPAA